MGLPGLPLPSAAPSTPTGNSIFKPDTGTGTSTPVVSVPAKTDAPVSKSDLLTASGKKVELAKPDSNPNGTEVKDPSEKAPEKNGVQLPQDLALQPVKEHSDDTVSIGVQTDKSTDAQNTEPLQLKPTVNHTSAFSSDVHGTSAAKQDMTMKKAEKMTNIAGPAEQDLPGNAATGSEELPTGQKLSVKASALGNSKSESATGTETTAASRFSPSIESAAPVITTVAVAPVVETDSRVRVLERTHDIVALHAMRLSETGSDSLHVVVKPGDGIQLSLELRKSQDGIEVHASLHKGDFEHLRQYWPELQQRMESRGVRVGTLTTSENFTSTSQQQFQQSKQQQSSNQDPMHAGAFAEFALAGSMSEAPATRAARATAYRGWETWA
jgi:hypothetical protein